MLTLFALACLPCLLAMIVTADVAAETAARAMRRRLRALRGRRSERRFARDVGIKDRPVTTDPVGPPIEQIAADLRRLGQQRIGVATRSTVWFAAVQRAYDQRLGLACHELEIVEHLDELTGIDLDIERVRIEGELQNAGLTLVSVNAQRSQDQR
ncbi:hypothetical protein [Rugosimonospora africana]|uniref:hypothetical protein n=1 Tax=Rugosimonospora africana TaxID=556532 RepID=UPI001EF35996|nr:hypothetical protein [Rugosimonospora africana]